MKELSDTVSVENDGVLIYIDPLYDRSSTSVVCFPITGVNVSEYAAVYYFALDIDNRYCR